MGVVWEARRVRDGARVALKVLAEADPAPQALARFQAEAAAAAALEHPGLVRLLEAGVERGVPWFAMELVEGEALDRRLRREGPLPQEEAVRLGAQVARALAAMHARGVLHRDVKPANVFQAGERALLGDFGLARDAERGRLTRTGQVLGTPEFMAPEQAEGRSEGVDASADVYALGATLYALLTGRPPFQGDGWVQVLGRVLQEPPEPPGRLRPGLDRKLEALVLRCLAKAPDERPESAEALAGELEGWLAGRGRRPARGRAPAALAALVVVGGALGAALILRAERPTPTPPAPRPSESGTPAATSAPPARTEEAEALRARVRTALEARAWSELDPALEALAAALPGDAEAWALRGEALLVRVSHRDTEPGSAREALEQACRPNPVSGRARALRSLARGRTGDPAGADEDARAALELAPDSALAWAAEGERRLRVLSAPPGGSGGDPRGLAAETLEAFGRALELEPDSHFAGQGRLEAAYALVQRGLIDGAEALAIRDALVEARPLDPYAWCKAGFLTKFWAEVAQAEPERRGWAEEALRFLDRAVELDPEGWYWLDQRGYTRLLAGDAEAAVEDLRLACGLTRHTDPPLLLGQARAQQGRLEEAEAALDEALRREPGHGRARLLRGQVRAQLGRRAEALADLERLLQLEPEGSPARGLAEQLLRELR